jgi:predicted amidohydrolase YtcJ
MSGSAQTGARPLSGPGQKRARPLSDLILHNGDMWAGRGRPPATTVVVRDGVIVSVGDDHVSSTAGPGARRIDLGGRTVIPAFHDAHAHIWKMGHLLTTMLDLRGVESVEAIVARVAEFRDTRPSGAWILGRGFNEAAMAEGRMPSRHDLDRAAVDQPVVLTRTCGHIYAVNSAALARAAITASTTAPVGGEIDHDAAGEPTGVLRETAMGLITKAMPPPTADDYERMIGAALTHQLSLGITMSACCGVSPELLAVYRAMDAGGRLPARLNVMPFRRVDGVAAPVPLPEMHRTPMLHVDTVKFLADGGLSGATAALSVPYRHSNTRGVLRFERAELESLCRESHDAGWRIATHAIGDVTIDQVLDIYEALGPRPPGLGHRIEHFGLPSAAQLARAARLGVVAVPQSIFLHELGRNFREYLPDALLPRCYPIRAMLDAGVTVALSSDAPVVENDNPLAGMTAAITRRDRSGQPLLPEQAITAEEALDAYTRGSAVAAGLGHALGTITPGYRADFAVLSGNPLTTPPEALSSLTVDTTILGGHIAYERA